MLGFAFVVALVGYLIHERVGAVSPHVIAVALGVVGATFGRVEPVLVPGLRMSAKKVLRIGIVVLAGALSGVGMAAHDIPLYFAGVDSTFALSLAGAMVASSALIGGVGAWLLRAALRRSGALDLIGA